MTVYTEIICIGNELLIGKIENTNAHWLAKRATQLGANVTRITVIQDIVEEIGKAINEAKARKLNFIITTGGLGPTFDDKTLQGVANALGRKLEVNPVALEFVRQRCIEYAKKRNLPTEIEMTPPRVKMAIFPKDTEPVTNPIGTAPALRTNMDGTVLFALPGVPAEMEAIFIQTIAPEIEQAVGKDVFCQRSLFVEGIFESRLAPLIDIVMKDNEGVYIKSHPLLSETKPGIELHLTMRTSQEQNPAEKLIKAAKEIANLIERNGGRVLVEL
jgi:nicotinamide-nucleotide amidase